MRGWARETHAPLSSESLGLGVFVLFHLLHLWLSEWFFGPGNVGSRSICQSCINWFLAGSIQRETLAGDQRASGGKGRDASSLRLWGVSAVSFIAPSTSQAGICLWLLSHQLKDGSGFLPGPPLDSLPTLWLSFQPFHLSSLHVNTPLLQILRVVSVY